MRYVITFAVFVCALGTTAGWSQEDQASIDNLWMIKKLELSQDILSALVTEDYDKIAEKATQLRRLSRLEGWARRTDQEQYRRQLRLFRRTAEALIREAEDKNLDGATLAFHHVTLSCVTCHRHLRTIESNQ